MKSANYRRCPKCHEGRLQFKRRRHGYRVYACDTCGAEGVATIRTGWNEQRYESVKFGKAGE